MRSSHLLFPLRARCMDALRWVYRHRWALGALCFLLAVALELSGSSLGIWQYMVPDESHPDTGVLLGVSRWIRSDEWAVFTPMTLSQYKSGFGLVSSLLRGGNTDVFMVYGLPVRDWSLLFRPFQIGYLFLGAARGLSFYWFGKLILLFLLSIEFGELLTGNKKRLSLVYAFLVTLSPVVQWWFSTNAFPDMLCYGQGLLLCLAGYLDSRSYKKRALWALGMFLCSGAYLLVLYPAWQIPFFYVFLSLGLWIILSKRKTALWTWKKDFPLLGGAVLLVCVCVGLIAARSWDVIQTVTHSAYPGLRLETGGGLFSGLFHYVGNLFFPYRGEDIPANACEMALFFDCFPLGILCALLSLRRDRRDGLTWTLLGLTAFLGAYTALGFPRWLSKLLLLSQSQGSRALVALSYVQILLLIRSLARGWEHIALKPMFSIPLAAVLALGMGFGAYRLVYSGYFTPVMAVLAVVVLFAVFLTALMGAKSFCALMLALSFLMGATVNPVRRGLDFLEDHSLGQAVEERAAESDGKWLAISEQFPAGNFLLMYGAPTLNCTNTYVNTALWETLDPKGDCREIYDRYAHILVSLGDVDKAQIELLNADQIHVIIDPDMLPSLGVEYLVSEQDLRAYSTEKTKITEDFSSPDVGYAIYRVESA